MLFKTYRNELINLLINSHTYMIYTHIYDEWPYISLYIVRRNLFYWLHYNSHVSSWCIHMNNLIAFNQSILFNVWYHSSIIHFVSTPCQDIELLVLSDECHCGDTVRFHCQVKRVIKTWNWPLAANTYCLIYVCSIRQQRWNRLHDVISALANLVTPWWDLGHVE